MCGARVDGRARCGARVLAFFFFFFFVFLGSAGAVSSRAASCSIHRDSRGHMGQMPWESGPLFSCLVQRRGQKGRDTYPSQKTEGATTATDHHTKDKRGSDPTAHEVDGAMCRRSNIEGTCRGMTDSCAGGN